MGEDNDNQDNNQNNQDNDDHDNSDKDHQDNQDGDRCGVVCLWKEQLASVWWRLHTGEQNIHY